MTSAYYQIPVSQKSKKSTAFMTSDGQYEFNVLPFGLVNVLMLFQEVIMGLLLQLEHQRNITSYEGEVIIPLKTVDDRLVILNESGLTLRDW